MKTTVEVFRSSAVQRTEQEVRWQAIGAMLQLCLELYWLALVP